jgi:MSHA biogenesis protein MshQ
LDGRVEGAAWVDGRLPGKFALYFRGCPGDMVVLPEQKRLQFAGAFSVAVWFKWGSFKTGKYQALIGKADTAWLLERDGHRNTLVFDTRYEPSPGADAPTAHLTPGRTDITDGRWHLAVGVYEPVGKVAKKQLYIDGRLDGENTTALPLYPNDNPVWIGANSQVAERAFYGFIDEVAMFGRALSTDEVAEMFEAGRPADSSKEQPQATTRETK